MKEIDASIDRGEGGEEKEKDRKEKESVYTEIFSILNKNGLGKGKTDLKTINKTHKLFTSCFLISIQYYNCKMQRPFDRYTPILSIFHLSIQNRYRTQYFTPFFNSIFRYHNNTPRTFTIHSKTITIWLFKPILY